MDRKWTHVMFAVAGLLLALVLSKVVDYGWGFFVSRTPGFTIGLISVGLAAVATYVAWRNERLFDLASEVATELRKVTWPSREETLNSTVVVIVTTIIAAGILGLFDGVWSLVTNKIYG